MKTKALITKTLKKKLIYFLILLPLFFTACATDVKTELLAPDWFTALEETEDENCTLIKIHTFADSEAESTQKAVDELYHRVLDLSGMSDFIIKSRDQLELRAMLLSLIESEEPLEGLVSLHRQEWLSDDGKSYYYGAFCIYKTAAETLEDGLWENYYRDDEALNAYLLSADSFETDNKYYSAAEELLKAALYVHQRSEPLSFQIAQRYIDRAGQLLMGITVSGVQAPDFAFANTFIATPFQLLCSSEESLVSAVEFLVRYEGKMRDGGKGLFERRLVSNDAGILEFYHPFLPFTGDAAIDFTPGSREFHSTFQILAADGFNVDILANWLDDSSKTYNIAVESAARQLSMGIVLLHTDITGTSLNTKESSLGMAEALSQDGFAVSVLNLDPAEIRRVDEPAFLRDITAFYKDNYVRVVYGTVRILDFESRDGSFRVKTGGELKIVDVVSGEVLMTLSLEKSVESRSNTLAVTASFKELGKAFAQAIINSLE